MFKLKSGKIKFSSKQLNQFKKFGIDVIYLFGSQTQGFAHSMSDIDIGIVFADPARYQDKTLDIYNKLDNIFREVFSRQEIDVVFLQFTPFDLQYSAIKDSQVLYKKSDEKNYNYREYVMKRVADLQYFYDMSYKAILNRI
jgi:predicted nucleotidyltransferase